MDLCCNEMTYYTVYCKSFKAEKFAVAKLNCSLLENICSWLIVLYDQSLLQAVSLERFAVTNQSQNFSTSNNLKYRVKLNFELHVKFA